MHTYKMPREFNETSPPEGDVLLSRIVRGSLAAKRTKSVQLLNKRRKKMMHHHTRGDGFEVTTETCGPEYKVTLQNRARIAEFFFKEEKTAWDFHKLLVDGITRFVLRSKEGYK